MITSANLSKKGTKGKIGQRSNQLAIEGKETKRDDADAPLKATRKRAFAYNELSDMVNRKEYHIEEETPWGTFS